MFTKYLLSSHKPSLLLILEDEDSDKHFSISINFVELFEEDQNIGNKILSDPEETLKLCDQFIVDAQQLVINEIQDKRKFVVKVNVHTRIFGLPTCPELHRNIFPDNQDLGSFLQISGTIVRMTSMKMLEHKRDYICKKCKFKITVNADYNMKYVIEPPKYCRNPEICNGTKMVPVSMLDSKHCKDYQEVKMQEQVSKLEVGMMPNTMWLTLEDDLVDVCKPGDSITVCGVVKRRWGSLSIGKKLQIELTIKANHIQINNDTSSTTLITPEINEQFEAFWEKFKFDPLYGRDLILKSFCPQIYGMYLVKLAVVTVLAGGCNFNSNNESKVHTRSEPHLLLCGDPGTGKSQLLRFASKVIPRSVLTTGIGSTSAGLTVAAFLEDGEWQLEGGALVLADGGICCIDEFNSMKEHDRTSIHEAMEQQTISVAKASIVCKLNTRCSILAATNPKGSLDKTQSLSTSVALASPLLSRFDLILLLKDNVDDNWDKLVADYILRGHKYKSKFFEDKHKSWTLEMLQAYFLIIKKNNPGLTTTSNKILSAYYQLQRKSVNRNKARTTVRLLDSLVRISQAHARLMYHKNVEIMDAITAVALIETSMNGDESIFELDFDVHANFPTDPMENYDILAKLILRKLCLNDILETDESNISISPNSTKRNICHEKKEEINITISQICFMNKKTIESDSVDEEVENAVKGIQIKHSENVDKGLVKGNKRKSFIQNNINKKHKISNENLENMDNVIEEEYLKSTKENVLLKKSAENIKESIRENTAKIISDKICDFNISLIPSCADSPDIEHILNQNIKDESIQQNEIIPQISNIYSSNNNLKHKQFNMVKSKSFAKSDSGNFSQTSSIFESQEDLDLEL